MPNINIETLKKFSGSGPRYTSYPPAPAFKASTSETLARKALQLTKQFDNPLSLYIHIPFCHSLCYYCGCNVSIRKNNPKYGDEYLSYLKKEIELITQYLGKHKSIQQIHLGGGTPTFLNTTQLETLINLCEKYFNIETNCEKAIEVDPRTVSLDQLKLLHQRGFRRLSIGVQDINAQTQKAINRIHSKKVISNLIQESRKIGYNSINLDLIYGLPHQTIESVTETMQFIISQKPDRIAFYSFAHVPWVKKHQSRINSEDLPNVDQKLKMFIQSKTLLEENGYKAIAMDHFALETDELYKAYSKGTLNRNFMGYTILPGENFLGLGASSISYLHGTYLQNIKKLPEYYKQLDHKKLALEKDYSLTEGDHIRKAVIEQLMCRFTIEPKSLELKYNIDFNNYFSNEQIHLQECIEDKLLEQHDKNYYCTELGKLFVRKIAMGFDTHLQQSPAKPLYSKVI